MKTLSLILTSLFFITQTVALAGLPSKDARQELADQLRQRGVELQRILESEGTEAAEAEVDRSKKWNLSQLSELRDKMIAQLTETEAASYLKTLKKLLASEDVSMSVDKNKTYLILMNRGLTEREKVKEIASLSTYQQFEAAFEKLKNNAREIGYEKALYQMADRLSNRDYENKERRPAGPNIFLGIAWFTICAGAAFLLAELTIKVFSGGETLAYVFWGICGVAMFVGGFGP